MHSPAARAAGAAMVLAAYYWLLVTHPFARSNDPAELQLQNDIHSSRELFEARRFADALPPTERLANQLSTEAIYQDRLARILHELHRPDAEAQAWERVMAASPTPVDACPMIAEAYQEAGVTDRAIAAFERCASLPPANPDFLLFLGQALLKANRNVEARVAFERGLAIDSTYPDLHLLLGIRRFDDGDHAGARESFDAFLRLAPERRSEVDVWLQRTAQKP